jgi:hypothetical protein
MLFLSIVDSKKLRNQIKTKTSCNWIDAKCGTFRDKCCGGLKCDGYEFLWIKAGRCKRE